MSSVSLSMRGDCPYPDNLCPLCAPVFERYLLPAAVHYSYIAPPPPPTVLFVCVPMVSGVDVGGGSGSVAGVGPPPSDTATPVATSSDLSSAGHSPAPTPGPAASLHHVVAVRPYNVADIIQVALAQAVCAWHRRIGERGLASLTSTSPLGDPSPWFTHARAPFPRVHVCSNIIPHCCCLVLPVRLIRVVHCLWWSLC